MSGGFDAAIARNVEFFARHGIAPKRSAVAVDLGAGCGFQSIPLARLGFTVTAIDLDRKLLDELVEHAEDLEIDTIQDDLMTFDKYVTEKIELAVCMVDTLLHLPSKSTVLALLAKVHAALQDGGKLIVTFRDLSKELSELDRFIPVRSDADTVFTCFLEYEGETVKVHDLVYRRQGSGWVLHKSFYRKLRIADRWLVDRLRDAGFGAVEASATSGLVTVIATK
jgi:precorrin-6B methylase 2